MRYLGNYKDWVKSELLDRVLSEQGDVRPGAEQNTKSIEQYNTWKEKENIGAAWSFHYNELGIDDIELPVEYSGRINWWFVKLYPTHTFPLHRDTFSDDSDKVRRLWIPYQDYIPGHVFICDNELIKDYRAGDIFEFTDPTVVHGSANLCTVPKVSLQVVIYLDQ